MDAYRQALELDSTNATAVVNSAIVLTSLGQLDSAKRLFVRDASVNSYALYHLALIDVEMGHPREGDSVRAIAHQRAPGFPYRGIFDSAPLYLVGKYDSAVVASRNGNPATRRVYAHIAMSVGRHAEARAALEGMIEHAVTIGDIGAALDAIATISLMESLSRNNRVNALSVLRDAERRFPLLSTPLSRRPYYQLAAAYAAAGDAARAEQLAAEAERGFSRGLQLWNREPAMIAKGWIAMTKGRPRDAVAALSAPVYCGGTAPRNLGGAGTTIRCPLPFLAEAYDRAGETDSARIAYERYVVAPFAPRVLTDGLVLAPSLQRLGELYEARGDRQTAARYYARLVEVWEHADPELQPRVEEMRRRAARLRESERR
jgi:tetratricopeptide (TPR) repeat protein